MEQTKVYVAEQGCYSDRGIVGIFSTEELAKKYCDECAKMKNYEAVNYYAYTLDELANHTYHTRYSAKIELETGKVSKKLPKFAYVTSSKEKIHLSVKSVQVESSISQEHANKLAVEARLAWLRKKTEPKDVQ